MAKIKEKKAKLSKDKMRLHTKYNNNVCADDKFYTENKFFFSS